MARLRLDFFDRYLKGVRNDVDRWPSVRYYTLGAERYAAAPRWPLAGTRVRRFYLDSGGALAGRAPTRSGSDAYTVDVGVTTGPDNRWATQMGRPVLGLSDRGAMDARMLTYTTPPLEADLHIAGSPVIDLIVGSTQADGAVLVYLEDVDESGRSRYLTEGGLRLIHRKLARDSVLGVEPYHSFARRDATPMPKGRAERVSIRILPTSALVKAGHRLRLAIAGADSAVFARVSTEGTPTLTVHRGARDVSVLSLPVVVSRPEP